MLLNYIAEYAVIKLFYLFKYLAQQFNVICYKEHLYICMYVSHFIWQNLDAP